MTYYFGVLGYAFWYQGSYLWHLLAKHYHLKLESKTSEMVPAIRMTYTEMMMKIDDDDDDDDDDCFAISVTELLSLNKVHLYLEYISCFVVVATIEYGWGMIRD